MLTIAIRQEDSFRRELLEINSDDHAMAANAMMDKTETASHDAMPFRILDLPTEMQHMVYNYFFHGATMIISRGLHDRGSSDLDIDQSSAHASYPSQLYKCCSAKGPES
jgi:hypothetical protein